MEGGRRGAGAQRCDCNATVVGLIATRRNKLLLINIFFSSLWHQGKSIALSSDTQHAIAQKIGGKWGNGFVNRKPVFIFTFFSFILYCAYSWVGRENIVSNTPFKTCRVPPLNAALYLVTKARK